MKIIQHRQGDILFTKVDKIPENYREGQDNNVIARGEVSGHKHQLLKGTFYRKSGWEKNSRYDETELPIGFCAVTVPTQVIHDEHDPVELDEGIWEVRRNMLRNLGYDEARKYGNILDVDGKYELMDISLNGRDMGRWMKMEDNTTTRVYLHPVPKELDMGRVKIPINTCKKALAWSFAVSPSAYKPIKET